MEAWRLFAVVDRVLAPNLSGTIRVVGGGRELAGSKLDQAEPPENQPLRELVALAPLAVDAFEDPAGAVELARPDRGVHDPEVRVPPPPGIGGGRCELCRLIDEPQGVRMAGPEATVGERRKRSGAQGVVVEPFGEVERGQRM